MLKKLKPLPKVVEPLQIPIRPVVSGGYPKAREDMRETYSPFNSKPKNKPSLTPSSNIDRTSIIQTLNQNKYKK